jgi:hypothetical protein
MPSVALYLIVRIFTRRGEIALNPANPGFSLHLILRISLYSTLITIELKGPMRRFAVATRSNPHTRQRTRTESERQRLRRAPPAVNTALCQPQHVVRRTRRSEMESGCGHQFIAEQVGVDAFAPGLNGLNGGCRSALKS